MNSYLGSRKYATCMFSEFVSLNAKCKKDICRTVLGTVVSATSILEQLVLTAFAGKSIRMLEA